MSEELKAKIKQIWEAAFNEGKLDALDEILAPNYVRHKPPFPDSVGLEAEKKRIADSRIGYPDAKLTLGEIIIEGDRSAALFTFEGAQTGQSPTTGAPPTNKHVKFTGCGMSRWENGKVVEEWEHSDFLGCFEQLGYVQKLW